IYKLASTHTVLDWAQGLIVEEILLLDRRAEPTCGAAQDHVAQVNKQHIQRIITSDIGMMGIYCPSRLFRRFPIAIDDVDTPINGLGPA
ncbi:hypothetical protein A2U01_0022161, partial [Trifolium medium]|nr:hypothetical protein [Trifolium medium]